MLPCMFHRRVI
uniref:Uncharacterized protein n=1 Tax=Anguilla anguilla TaxID=7936 RepID=A0A0E9VBF6_ANGAN